jgi:hypothetical protein
MVGPHRIDLEFPDIVHIHYCGDVEIGHFLGFDEVILALPPPPQLLYLLRDARQGGLVTAETRAHIAKTNTGTRWVGIVTYGSSFQTRTVFSNMNRALKTVRTSTVPVEFFDTEAEARAWIELLRSELPPVSQGPA